MRSGRLNIRRERQLGLISLTKNKKGIITWTNTYVSVRAVTLVVGLLRGEEPVRGVEAAGEQPEVRVLLAALDEVLRHAVRQDLVERVVRARQRRLVLADRHLDDGGREGREGNFDEVEVHRSQWSGD